MHKIALQVKTQNELVETSNMLASNSIDHKLWVCPCVFRCTMTRLCVTRPSAVTDCGAGW